MSLWLFPSPQVIRVKIPLESRPIFSLWTRVHRDVPSTILLNQQGQWEEWPYAWPQTENPRNKYLFSHQSGDGGCFSTMGTDQSLWTYPQRLYLGGHQYIISDKLANELQVATTTYQTGGYGSYIIPAPPGSVMTGDELMLSGFDDVHPKVPLQ